MKKMLFAIIAFCFLCGCSESKTDSFESSQEEIVEDYGTDYESTWGKLIEENGGEPVWGTLTAEQQELVNYPYLDKECVYYVPNGEAYHSVDWCYTLERSKTILSIDYDEAISSGLGPCSKCVGD